MARLAIALDRVRNGAMSSGTMPVPTSITDASELLNTTAASAQSVMTASQTSQYWIVTALDGNVWVNFGPNPTAVAGSGWLIVNGTTREFSVSAANEKLAAVDA
jgi:hypothetical protein